MVKIYDNVELGENVKIEDFVLLGISPSRKKKMLNIGKNSVIRAGTYIYEDNVIGNNFQTGNKVNIRETNKIGNHVSIGTGTVIEHHVVIHDNVRIHSNCFIPEYSIIKENVWIGPNVTFTNARFPKSKNVKNELKGPIINENAIIGASVTILPGVSIGKYSIIGAGCVVSKNVSDYQIIIGNPQKIIGDIRELKDDKDNLIYDL